MLNEDDAPKSDPLEEILAKATAQPLPEPSDRESPSEDGGPGNGGGDGAPNGNGGEPPRRRRSAAMRCLESALGRYAFFLDADGAVYADVVEPMSQTAEQSRTGQPRIVSYRRTHSIGSDDFKLIITNIFLNEIEEVPSEEDIKKVLRGISARCKTNPNIVRRVVAMRTHRRGDAIYIDMCDYEGRTIVISKSGWKIIDGGEKGYGDDSFRFIRTRNMLPLPDPERIHRRAGELIDFQLPELFNLRSADDEFNAIMAQLSLLTNGPYAILVLQGPAGAAKSTMLDLLPSIIDPNANPRQMMPLKEDGFIASVIDNFVVRLDNVSGITPVMSDRICAIATGTSIVMRELYTTSASRTFKVKRPFIINGISNVTHRPDFLSRALFINLREIRADERKTESEIMERFPAAHPRLLASFLDVAVYGLVHEHEFVGVRLPRMADTAQWWLACSGAFVPGGAARIQEMFEEAGLVQARELMEGSPHAKLIVAALSKVVKSGERNGDHWDYSIDENGVHTVDITAKRLFEEMEDAVETCDVKLSKPLFINAMKSYINWNTPGFTEAGVKIRSRSLGGRVRYVFTFKEVDAFGLLGDSF